MTYTRTSPLRTTGTVSPEAIQAWLESEVAWGAGVVGLPPVPVPLDMGKIIVEECARYFPVVVNYDLVAAQVNHESAACQSRIARDKRNYCGYGAENDDPYGKAYTFSSPREGVKTQVAHLLGYVVGDGPWNALSPRYSIVRRNGWAGTVTTLADLEQKWAYTAPAKYKATPPDERYGAKVAAHANRLLAYANDHAWDKEPPMTDKPQILQMLVPDGASNKPNRAMQPAYITIHETANPAAGADAVMHGKWLLNLARQGAGEPSWHFTVDEDQIVQHLRLDEMGWHAGDGANGTGNRESIGIELCVNQGADFAATMHRAAGLVAWLMGQFGIPITNVVQHNRWSGKFCPATIRNQNLWEPFLQMVRDAAIPPPATDKWVIEQNPFGPFGWVMGFRDTAQKLARAKYPADENASILSIIGWAKEDEWLGDDGCSYQRNERATFKYDPNAAAPWDIVLMLPDTPLPARKDG